MRFVQVKSAEQQAQLMQHRARDLLMHQRTQLINALRSHLAELGIIAPQGREGIKELLAIIADDANTHLPNDARASLIVLAAQLQALQTTIGAIEKRITVQPSRHQREQATSDHSRDRGYWCVCNRRHGDESQDLPIRARLCCLDWAGAATNVDRGKPKLGPISKQGDRYLRRILVVGAVSVLRRAKGNPQKFPWVTRLLARRPFKVVAVALANKMARIAWALLISGKNLSICMVAAA